MPEFCLGYWALSVKYTEAEERNFSQQWSNTLNLDAKLKKKELQQWSNNESKTIANEQ